MTWDYEAQARASNTCLVSKRFYRQICTKLSHRILDKQNIFGHPSVCFKNAHITELLFSDRMFKRYSRAGLVFGLFRLIISRCPGSFWSGPEFLFCSKTFLHSPKEGSSGSSRQQNSWNVELINFLPSSNSRPRYLIYEYRWRVSAGICQNTHLTLPR